VISRLQWLLLALAVGATVALTWRWEFDAPDDGPAARTRSGPDLYMEGAVIDQFDEAGALRYRLTARAIAHYPDPSRTTRADATDADGTGTGDAGGITRLQAPVLLLLQDGSATGTPSWEARARVGEVRSTPSANGQPRSDVVLLQDQVELTQRRVGAAGGTTGAAGGPAKVRLRTERLTIRPLAKTAQTDLAVIIDTDTGRTVAAGMRGELETGRIALTSGSRQRVTTVVQSRPF
jgi:lipopolysaccharide export system protein LptC